MVFIVKIVSLFSGIGGFELGMMDALGEKKCRNITCKRNR